MSIPIEKREIKGLTVGQFITVIVGISGILISSITGYHSIANKLEMNTKFVNIIMDDKKNQEQTNKLIELSIRTLETRLTVIETQIKLQTLPK